MNYTFWVQKKSVTDYSVCLFSGHCTFVGLEKLTEKVVTILLQQTRFKVLLLSVRRSWPLTIQFKTSSPRLYPPHLILIFLFIFCRSF